MPIPIERRGVLVVSTQSSHNLGYTLNPLSLLEKALSLIEGRVLPPYHGLHARFEYDRKHPEPEYGIHYHFSQKQLRSMIARNGFRILWEGTFEIEIVPYLYVELFSDGNVGRIQKAIRPSSVSPESSFFQSLWPASALGCTEDVLCLAHPQFF